MLAVNIRYVRFFHYFFVCFIFCSCLSVCPRSSSLPPPLQDLAGNLERARASVKPPTKGDKSGGVASGGGSQDEDDATAQELGLTAEVYCVPGTR